MPAAHLFALGLALAALAGVRAYLTVFGIGLAGLLGWVDLPPALQVTTSPWVLGTAGILTVTEIPFTNGAQMDSVGAGDGFRLRITRDAANDDMTGDA